MRLPEVAAFLVSLMFCWQDDEHSTGKKPVVSGYGCKPDRSAIRPITLLREKEFNFITSRYVFLYAPSRHSSSFA